MTSLYEIIYKTLYLSTLLYWEGLEVSFLNKKIKIKINWFINTNFLKYDTLTCTVIIFFDFQK